MLTCAPEGILLIVIAPVGTAVVATGVMVTTCTDRSTIRVAAGVGVAVGAMMDLADTTGARTIMARRSNEKRTILFIIIQIRIDSPESICVAKLFPGYISRISRTGGGNIW